MYTDAVKNYDGTFVEVGSWAGRSAAFMAVEIINSGKDIQFYCVDTWLGSEEHKNVPTNLYDIFLDNTKDLNVYSIRKPSVEAAEFFADKSVSFCYIDAAHDYENVRADIMAWLPKIKKGGMLAGHDYPYGDVKRAVNELLSATADGSSWIFKKE